MTDANTTARLEDLTCDWLAALQRAHRAAIVPLPDRMHADLVRFFPASTIQRARMAFVPVIPTPPFSDEGITAGIPAGAFAERGALTVDDTVFLNLSRISASSGTMPGVIFHELVHVHQFQALGVRRFVHEYLTTLISMQNDQLIPLERVAYAAQAMYLQYPEEPFSVDEMVRGER